MTTDTQFIDLTTCTEEYTREQLIGLVSSLLDGEIIQFTYQGLSIYSTDGSMIYVTDDNEGVCHGEMIVTGKPVLTTLDWIEAKAEAYGTEEIHD